MELLSEVLEFVLNVHNQTLIRMIIILYSMEAREEQNNSQEESESRHSINKTRQIIKSPKPNKRPPELLNNHPKDNVESNLRITSQYGVFESESQRQSRLQKFWLVQIDNFYRKEIKSKQIQMLRGITGESIPSLHEVITSSSPFQRCLRVPFEQLYRYVELIRQCRGGEQLLIVQNQSKHYLAVFESQSKLSRLIEISAEESILLDERIKFMVALDKKQEGYNRERNSSQRLSELSSQTAFVLYMMRKNKKRVDDSIGCILSKISEQGVRQPVLYDQARDKYVVCLIKKNLKNALADSEIDYLNYYANLDAVEQYGTADEQQKLITDKKEFQQFIKRKKSKKARKNNKAILKTACAACLSPHYEQYNPLLYCSDCQTRYHKYCYTPFKDGLCEACFNKKQPIARGRNIECQLCSVRGLLTVPLKSNKENVSMHVFCMLINSLWKFENGTLEFKANSFVSPNMQNDACSICNLAVYTYPCRHCQNKAHPLCAYINGWRVSLGEEGVQLECSCSGVKTEQQSYRRKFMLNYKKMLYKSDRER